MLDNNLYRRLAKANLSRNRQMYLPYGIALAIMSAMFFIITNIVMSKTVSNMSFGDTMVAMLTIGLVVMGIFTFGYMFYLNSFLIKRRRREFGLYGILGLEKRHVGRIIFIENMRLNLLSLVCGLTAGTVFGKLAFMALLSVLNVAPGSRFDLAPTAYLITIVYFCAIFMVNTVYNQFQVRLANPIDLINGEKQGEKKLRFILPMTLLGVLCLGAAYFAAISVDSASFALVLFWPAVVLVILGTNLLFLSGSQFVLRGIKNNPKLYYKPRSFISVSGLIHRMRQNANGLANICILSTMVLVTVSCCCSLYFGQEDILRRQNPNDYSFRYRASNYDLGAMKDAAHSLALEKGVTIDDIISYDYLFTPMIEVSEGRLGFPDSDGMYPYGGISMCRARIITAEAYACVTGDAAAIPSGGVLILSEQKISPLSALTIDGQSFPVVGIESGTLFTDGKNSPDFDSLMFVTDTAETARRLCDACHSGEDGQEDWYLCFEMNLSGEGEARLAFSEKVGEDIYLALNTDREAVSSYYYDSIDISRSESYGLYGGLLFLGVLFAMLFITNTVLIMYFKQVSEGYEDRARYGIMRSVGMSDEEVRGTINRQVLIVFFLPLIVAFMHIFAATNMMTLMLNAFVMMNNSLTLACIAVTCALYAVVYVAAFRTTAHTYYRIVK